MKTKIKPKLSKEEKEAQVILKDIEKNKVKAPKDEKDILKWSVAQLRAYILDKTATLKPKQKMKFGRDLLKRIKEEKKKQNLKT